MNKKSPIIMALMAFVLAITFVVFPTGNVSAEIADGSYQIKYEMKEASSDSTSIANGYFSKPATLTVKNGVKHIQLTVTSSSMIKSLSAPSGAVTVVSEDVGNETRTVKFRVDGDLSQPVNMKMHIIVPDLYDQEHSARAVFDVSGLESASSKTSKTEDSSDDGAAATATAGEDNKSSKAEDNPPTGDSTPIALYVTLLLGSVGIFTVYKLRTARN